MPSEISSEFVTMEELQDSTRPAISVAILNLGNGDFTLNISKQWTRHHRQCNFKAFVIRNDSSNLDSQSMNISNTGGTYIPINVYSNLYNDSTSITFKLTEKQRSILLRWSGHTGGDGIASLLYVENNAFLILH